MKGVDLLLFIISIIYLLFYINSKKKKKLPQEQEKLYCLYCGEECKHIYDNLYFCPQSYTLWIRKGYTFHAFYLKDVVHRSIDYCPYCGGKSVWQSGTWCSRCNINFEVKEYLPKENNYEENDR